MMIRSIKDLRSKRGLLPTTCRTSDLEFDFGPRVLPDGQTLHDRWRAEQVEEEHGLRADVYRSLGM